MTHHSSGGLDDLDMEVAESVSESELTFLLCLHIVGGTVRFPCATLRKVLNSLLRAPSS